jgi:O-antigen ligase
MFPATSDLNRKRDFTGRRVNPISKLLSNIVFWGLLALIPIAVIPYGTVDAWWESIFESGVFGLAAVAVLEAFFMRRWQVREISVLLPAGLLTLYAFLQTMQWPPSWLIASSTRYMLTIDHYQTYLTARKMLALTLFLGLLLGHVSTPKRFRWTVRAVIAAGLGSALFGILRQFVQTADAPSGFVLPFLFYGLGYAQFISPNVFAYLMEMTLGLLAGLVLGGGVGRNRALIYLAVMAVVWTALVLSNSRGGLMALGCEAVFVVIIALNWFSERRSLLGERVSQWMLLLRQSNFIRVVVILSLLSILAGGVLWMGGDQLANKLGQQSNSVENRTDGSTRQEIWRASWKLFRANPLTGTGFGAYFLGITQFQVSSGPARLQQAHNDYLDLAANGGLVAVILGAWFGAAVVRIAKRRLRHKNVHRRAAALGAATALLGAAMHSVVDFGLQVTGIAVVFLTMIVILIADVRADAADAPSSLTSDRFTLPLKEK